MIYPLALIAATILFAAIAWRDVRHGVYLIAALLPAYLLRSSVGPIPTTLLEGMILTVVLIYIAKTRPSLRSIVPNGWALPMGLLLLAATVGILVAPDRLSALGIWKAFYLEPMLLFAVIADLIRRDVSSHVSPPHGEEGTGVVVERILIALAAGGLFVAVAAIAQKLTGLGIPIPWDVEGRVTSVFPYPNAVGLYLGPIVVMSAILSLRAHQSEAISRVGLLRFARNDKTILLISTAFLGFVAIVLAQSEAAIAAVLATLFLAAISTRRFRTPAIAAACLSVLLVLSVPASRGYLLDKLAFRDYSETVRLSQWAETVDMLKDNPIFGAGLNGYPTAMIPYHRATHIEIFQYPHTLFLNIWVELGILGLVAFGLVAWRVEQSAISNFQFPISLAFFPLLAMTLHSLFDVPYFKNDLAAMTWIFLAVVAASYAKNSRVSE